MIDSGEYILMDDVPTKKVGAALSVSIRFIRSLQRRKRND